MKKLIATIAILMIIIIGVVIWKNYDTSYAWDERNDYMCMEDERNDLC